MKPCKWVAIPRILALSLVVGGCAQSPDADETVQITSELSASEVGCGTGTPEATLTASGTVRSNASYNPSACARAYRVNVNNYSPGVMGALVAYAGAIPTNADECARTNLRTYVWRRNADGTATFMNNAIRSGTWVNDRLGGMRCATPNLDLSTFFTPSQLPRGGNFRIAARASILPPTGSTAAEVYKEIVFSIPPGIPFALGPDGIVNAMQNLGATLGTQGSTIFPDVQRLWNLRTSNPRVLASACRNWELQISAFRANALSLKRVVPATSAATVDVRTTTADQIYTLLCNTPNPPASAVQTLQTALSTHLLWPMNIRQQVATFLGGNTLEAGQLIGQSYNLDSQRLMTRCGATFPEMASYIATGARPAGMLGANVLLRNCTGSIGTIAASAGVGVSTTTDPKTKYRACVDKQTATMIPSCAGPRSDEPANADPTDSPTQFDGPCEQGKIWDADTDTCLTEDELKAINPEFQTTAEQTRTYIAAVEGYEESNRRADDLALTAKLQTFGAAVFGLAGTAVPPMLFFSGLGLGGALVSEINSTNERSRAAEYREIVCKMDPGNAEICGNRNMCPEYNFLGDRVWAQTSPTPINPDGRETTQGERLDDCLCQLFDKDYGKTSGFEFGGASPFCPDSHAALVEDCFRNPEVIGTTDARKPRPECVALMYPKELDRSALLVRYCHAMMPNCPGAYVDDQGGCACPGGGSGLPVAGNPSCPTGPTVTDCGPEAYLDEKNCHCVSFDSGLGCARGGISGYLARRPSDVYVAAFPNEATTIRNKNFLMFAPGNTPVATRNILRSGLSSSMTQVKLFTRLPTTTLSSGYQGWAVQLSCTNEGNNVQNRSIGTAQLQSLPAGGNTLTYALTAADRTACFNGDRTPVRFEIRSNNQVGQPRIGVEDLSVTNLIDDLPNLPDPCSPPPNPAPDPIPISLPPSLTFDGLFGETNWRFSEGTLTPLPVIR